MKHKHDPQTFRRFLFRWIGIHVVCTLVFFIFHSLCFGVGLLVSNYSITLRGVDWNDLVWDMCATLAPTFSLLPTLVILSLLQARISRRTIDVLPEHWFRTTSLAYIPVYLLLFMFLFREVEISTQRITRSSLETLFVPMYIMFMWMAIVQGMCFLRHGIVTAVLWGLGCVLPIIVLIPFNESVYIDTGTLIFNFYPLLILYPLLLSFVTGGLCYRLWKMADLRKRHTD